MPGGGGQSQSPPPLTHTDTDTLGGETDERDRDGQTERYGQADRKRQTEETDKETEETERELLS